MEISCFKVEESKELAVIQEFVLEEGIFTDILDEICMNMSRLGIQLDDKCVFYQRYANKTSILAIKLCKGEDSDTNNFTSLLLFYSSYGPSVVTVKGQPHDFFAKAVDSIKNNLFQPAKSQTDDFCENKKPKKIFISHSEFDVKYAECIVDLLYDIGVPKQEGNILCTSVNGCRIPLGNDIYEYLREQFENYDLLILFLLSENYYNSPASLNEMGAAWVLRSNYRTILLPGFEYKNIQGAINPMKVSMKIDAASVKDYLEDLKIQVEQFFDFAPVSHRIWENDRDNFLKKISKL